MFNYEKTIRKVIKKYFETHTERKLASDIEFYKQELYSHTAYVIEKGNQEGKGYDPEKGSTIEAYIYKIVSNKVKSIVGDIRKNEERDRLFKEHQIRNGLDAINIENEREEKKVKDKKIIKELLSTLSDKDRILLEAYYFSRLTLLEISEEVGCTYAAIKMRHYHAIRRLRKNAKKFGYKYP